MILLMVIALVAGGGVPASTAEEWSCQSDNDGLPQMLTVKFADGLLEAFDYTSMAPSASGDTKYTCSVSASRTDGESTWKDEPAGTRVHPQYAVADDDEVVITRVQQTVTLRLTMSPSNCGPSTPLASAISVT